MESMLVRSCYISPYLWYIVRRAFDKKKVQQVWFLSLTVLIYIGTYAT